MANSIPTIQTPHLTLRPFSLDDLAPFHRILNEPDILQYFPNPSPPSLERVESIIQRQLVHWQEHNLGWWAVVPHEQIDFIGWNGLQFLPETGEVEVGYLLSRSYWRKGYASEGARAGLNYGFRTLKLDQIIGLVHEENIASQKVLEKCGLTFTRRTEYFGMELLRYKITSQEFERISA